MKIDSIELKFKKLDERAIIPKYQTEGSAGFDLCSIEYIDIPPRHFEPVSTGLAVEIPKGFEIQIRQRSGLSMTYYNYISNSPGTIDSDYRGEINILIYNHSNEVWHICPEDRIAQGVICYVPQIKIVEVGELTETKRGSGGFGSTGVRSKKYKWFHYIRK